MAKRASWIAGAAAVLAGGAAFYLLRTEHGAVAPLADRALSGPVALSSASPSRSTAPKIPTAASRARASRSDPWPAFSARFGARLKPTRGVGGRVVAVQGAPGSGETSPEFDPRDAQKVVARAREILEAAGEMLGFDPDAPLGEATVRTGPVSAQVHFGETQDGLPVQPFGSVSVDLGPKGEILGLSSDYVGKVPVVNQRAIDADQARGKAEAAVSAAGGGLGTRGGTPILWVSRSGPDGTPVGHHAYNYDVSGRQVVVDAQDGAVLFQRDRRQL